MTQFNTILFQVENGVAIITLNRPDRMNAINTQMFEDLNAALDTCERDDTIRCLVLTGSGRGFCAGQDLHDRKVNKSAERPDLGKTVGENYNPFLMRLYNLSMPTLAAVNGTAAGAGANFALACDMVIAAESAKFIQVYSNIGLIPDSGGTFILPRLVGLARAKEMCMSARPIKADEAVSIGMIARMVGDDMLLETVMKIAMDMAQKPTLGLALTKQAFHQSFSNDLEAQLECERQMMQKAGFSDDYKEGVSAFLEKRKPVFKGK